MISLVQINYILTLLEEKNFQRAADKCFVTQPTLSIQIKKAEKTLGGQLFNRETNPLEATPFLLSILPQLLLIEQDVKALEEEIIKESTDKKERIKIGIIPTVAQYMIPDLYGVFKELLPKYEIDFEEIRTTELLEKLALRKVDLAILSAPSSNHNFQIQKLFIEEIYFYFQNPIPLKSINELKKMQPWLLSEGNCLRSQMINFCDLKNDAIEKWNYQGGNIDVLIRMVENYGGYTLIPTNYPQKNLDQSKIVKLSDTKPARNIVACYNRRTNKEQAYFKLFHSIQSIYANEKHENWELLSWE